MAAAVKTCFKCETEKPLTDFYRHPDMKDGHLNKCKQCTALDTKRNRPTYASTASGKEAIARGHRTYRERHPGRVAAHDAINNAIKLGHVARQPCEVCGATQVEAHHDDYTRPLAVRWLCKRHHDEHHSNEKGMNP